MALKSSHSAVMLMSCVVVLLFFVVYADSDPANISYTIERVRGIKLQVISVNLNDNNIRIAVEVSQRGIGSSEPFGSFVRRIGATAAITGTYFDPGTRIPVGDIVVKGKWINEGKVGTAFCVDRETGISMMNLKEARQRGLNVFESVLCAGPRLLCDGKIVLDPRSEGFRDRNLFNRRPRAAIALTKSNRLLLVTVHKSVYLGELARALKRLDALDAINLDGGSSSALYYKGSVITKPGRRLTNLLAVYGSG